MPGRHLCLAGMQSGPPESGCCTWLARGHFAPDTSQTGPLRTGPGHWNGFVHNPWAAQVPRNQKPVSPLASGQDTETWAGPGDLV